MATEDKEKWDKKYSTKNNIDNKPIDLVKYYYKLAHRGLALDIACGTGRHSIFLAQNEFEVDALDISYKALENIQNTANIYPREVDFDKFKIIKNTYDLVVCTYFLDRDILDDIQKSLANNGILIYETFIEHKENSIKFKNPDFMLQKGELKSSFDDLEIIFYEEWWDEKDGDKTLKASLVARKN
jgi:SAM-dependent methyltransferase